MIIDMHVHTEMSMDSNATVEAYCQAIQRFRKIHPFDGMVVTEHRMFRKDQNYQKLSEKYDVLIFQGVEIDASLGHLLIYGVADDFLKQVDISSRSVKEKDVLKAIRDCGGMAIPAHPFRDSTYGSAFEQGDPAVRGMTVVEELNGANSREENQKAQNLVARNGLKGIGGSDAHYANKHWFLTCATEFFDPIRTMDDLIGALRAGHFRPRFLDNSALGDF